MLHQPHPHRPLMKFKIPPIPLSSSKNSCFPILKSLMASSLTQTQTQTLTIHSDPPQPDPEDDLLCSDQQQQQQQQQLLLPSSDTSPFSLGSLTRCLAGESHIDRAWAHWLKLGRPRLIVAPMVDNSELPFRMLCRKYGAEAAYTPMLHSRIFTETAKYRDQEFTTCKVFNS